MLLGLIICTQAGLTTLSITTPSIAIKNETLSITKLNIKMQHSA